MHFKKIINQGSFYFQGLRSFKDTLPKNVKKIINKKGHVFSEILNNWVYLTGKKISNVSFPKSFKPNGKGFGVLIISVQRGNEIDVEYSKSLIIKKINTYFGWAVLDRIKIEKFNKQMIVKVKKHHTISSASKNRYLKSINNVKNEKIKKSLMDLANNIK